MITLSAILKAALAWLSKLPRSVLIVAGAVILFAGALFWAYEHGKTVGARAEQVREDLQRTKTAMSIRDTIAKKVVTQTHIVEADAPKLRAAHAAAAIVDSTRLVVQVTPDRIDTVIVPAPVVARIMADSLAIVERDNLIILLQANVRADSVVIADQSALIEHLGAPKPAVMSAKRGAVIGALATGAALLVGLFLLHR